MAKEPVGLLIPEFPGQTHIAWWRVGCEIRNLGHEVQFLSTRCPNDASGVHKLLDEEAQHVFYAWPPRPMNVAGTLFKNPVGVGRAVAYLASLGQSSLRQKMALLPVLVGAINLSAELRVRGIERVFVHSCANAAHLVAMCHRITGVRYALRLGGDPDVYGRDHYSKMRAAEFILSGSPTYFKELVEQHGVDRSKLFWSWVGTDVGFYGVDGDWPHNRDGDLLRIATVGRLNNVKGHIYVLQAIRDLVAEGHRISYTIVGEGPFRGEIERSIETYALGEHVRLTGAIDAAAIARRLRTTDFVVMSSFGAGESSPAVISEAMASGVPAIATRIGATDHMINDGIDGFLVDQRDSAAIRDRLREVLSDPERLARMKSAARQAAAKFDVRLTAERVLDLFEQARQRESR